MSRAILLVSGPNLDQLGRREPAIYGTASLADHVATARDAARAAAFELEHVQSSSEGVLIDAVHEARGRFEAIVVNAGALTHYGWGLHDALASFPGVVVEVHLSNPASREPWRRRSVVAPVAGASIAGAGGIGYRLAVMAAVELSARREAGE